MIKSGLLKQKCKVRLAFKISVTRESRRKSIRSSQADTLKVCENSMPVHDKLSQKQ